MTADAAPFERCDVAIVDAQEHTGTTWVRDVAYAEAVRLAAYWRTVPGFRASTYAAAADTSNLRATWAIPGRL